MKLEGKVARVYPVEIVSEEGRKVYSPEFQTKREFQEGWLSVLRKHHLKGTVRCLCPGSGRKELSIKYREDVNTYYLARHPGTGYEHSPDCVYYGPPEVTSPSGKELKVYLPKGVKTRRGPQRASSPAKTRPSTSGRKRQKASRRQLSGFFDFLLEVAGVKGWERVEEIGDRIRRAAPRIRIGSVPLSRTLCVAAVSEDSPEAKENHVVVKRASQKKLRLLVVAPLARFSESHLSESRIPIAYFHGIPFLKIRPELWEKVKEKFREEIRDWKEGAEVWTLVQTDPPVDGKQAFVVDMALKVLFKRKTSSEKTESQSVESLEASA